MYIPVAIAIGALTGLLRGGSLRNLAHASFRLSALLVLGCLLQLAVFVEALEPAGTALLVVSYLCLIGFALANVAHRGMGLVAIGIALNAVVIAINGGMPVKAEAIVAAGIVGSVAEAEALEFRGKRHLATEEDSLVILGDVIPVPVGGGSVLSYGDVVLALGAAVVLHSLVRNGRNE